jgi:hypothetical protein
MLKTLALSAGLLVAAMATGASALPGVPMQAAGDGVLVKVHGCHRSCEHGPVLGWHRHGAYCRPIACAPRAVFPGRCFVDRFGVRRCRW